MKRSFVKKKLARYGPFMVILFCFLMFSVGAASAGTPVCDTPGATITIGGNIYTGSKLPDGSPNYNTAAALSGANVMVQTMHSGGKFVAFGTVTGNQWSAVVPDPSQCKKPYNGYVIMFSADGHDATSREWPPNDASHPNAPLSQNAINAYLPTVPLESASLLVYAFYDNYINSEDDAPADPPLNGVTFIVTDEAGVTHYGVTGQASTNPKDSTVFQKDGHYYFHNLAPGKVEVSSTPYVVPGVTGSGVHIAPNPQLESVNADPPGRNDATLQAGDQYYLLTTEEGGPDWDPKLYPGDPGTMGGVGYLIWHGYVKKMGQYPVAGGGTGVINGNCEDADPALNPADVVEAVLWTKSHNVKTNEFVPDCLLVLYGTPGGGPLRPIATTEADNNNNSRYEFRNLPPGNYRLFISDIPLDYVWQEGGVQLGIGQTFTVPPLVSYHAGGPGVPRFFGRAHGYVTLGGTLTEITNPDGSITVESVGGTPVVGAKVNLRYKSGSIKQVTYTDTTGWYNFDDLPEIEVMGHVDVDLAYLMPGNVTSDPDNPYFSQRTTGEYRGSIQDENYYPNSTITYNPTTVTINPGPPTVVTHNAMNRYIAWLTANYRSDLIIEPVPTGEGQIQGYVFVDSFSRPATPADPWAANGTYEPDREILSSGRTVELYAAGGITLVSSVKTGKLDKGTLAVEQGYAGPYSYQDPPNEFGSVYAGPMIGFYEFRGVAPGKYNLKVVLPAGFDYANDGPMDYSLIPVIVTDGGVVYQDLGIKNAQPVPMAGEVEGGVFDDVNIDYRTYSLLQFEKAGINKVPVGIYDHNGYFMGSANMGNPICFANPPAKFDLNTDGRVDACPLDEPASQKPEVERRAAPGVHLYLGNDPLLVDYNPCYEPLVMPYTFHAGGFKFEADWSLLPAFLNPLNPNHVAHVIPALGDVIGNALDIPASVITPPPDMMYMVPPLFLSSYFDDISNCKLLDPANYTTNDYHSYTMQPTNDPITVAAAVVEIGDPAAQAIFASSAYRLAFPDSMSVPAQNALTKQVTLHFAGRGGRIGRGARRGPINTNITITGSNFGDEQGYSTVSIGGRQLEIVSWSDTRIVVKSPTTPNFPQGSAIIVATSTGISESIPVNAQFGPTWARYLDRRTVYVEAGNTGGDGSRWNPYGTITEALNNLPTAKPRYVVVAAGTYNERIHITESDIRIIGAGPKETILNGTSAVTVVGQGPMGGGSVIHIGNAPGNGSVRNIAISGLTIMGGNTKDQIGGGIFGDYGNRNIDINNSVITMNSGYYGGGIWFHYSNHNVKIWSNVINRNGNYGGYGGGISINDEPEYTTNETFPGFDHSPNDSQYTTPPGTYRIFNNLIYRNYSPDYGGGISLYEIKDHLVIYGNMIVENESEDHGGGLFFEDTGPIDLYGNTLFRNRAWDDGGAISFEDVGDFNAVIKIHDNLIAQNFIDDRSLTSGNGAGIAIEDTFQVEIYNNIITGNILAGELYPAGGGIDSERNGHEYELGATYNGVSTYRAPGFSDPVIHDNIIWNNWRLNYDKGPKVLEIPTWGKGTNFVWTMDNIHVDDPAAQPVYEKHNDAQSLTSVYDNIVSAGDNDYAGNSTADPWFVDPENLDWHLMPGSPATGKGPASILRFPTGIMGAVAFPKPPSVP